MQKNDCVVIIPAYEPSVKFIDYAKQILETKIAQLIVVNDGSGEKYSHIYEEISKLPNAVVLSYKENKGKGFALRTAFKYCKENYDERYTFVTADCDGQHLVKDVLNVASFATEFGDSFVLGVRDFSEKQVPKRSRLGNVTTRRCFRLLYGVRISDTQTGLRAFPYSMIDALLKIKGDRFEYEMNQLVVLHKKDIAIREVPITTVYEKKPADVEKISHYNTVRDSLRVAKVLMTNLSWYMVAAVLSAIVELTLGYVGLLHLPVDGIWLLSRAAFAQLIARLGSSVVNFIVNYKFVFNGHSKKSVFKYYILWATLFGLSLWFAHLFGKWLPQRPSLVVFYTGCTTVIMSLFSYQVQTRWVFAGGKRKNGKFWGLTSRCARFFYRVFTKKYTSLVAKDPMGAVYVCRHLNMHGPYTTITQLGFDVHLMAFSVFCSWKECFKHFRDYNFMKVMKMNKFLATICAFFLANFVVPMTRSLEAIPVFRKNTQSIITLRRALKSLEIHENIILFPDVSYQANQETETDIYSGFLLLEKMYYKKFGKHLRFIPLVIDEENATIIEKAPIRFKNGDYQSQVEGIKEKIMVAIGCAKKDGEFLNKIHNASLEEKTRKQENASSNSEEPNLVNGFAKETVANEPLVSNKN